MSINVNSVTPSVMTENAPVMPENGAVMTVKSPVMTGYTGYTDFSSFSNNSKNNNMEQGDSAVTGVSKKPCHNVSNVSYRGKTLSYRAPDLSERPPVMPIDGVFRVGPLKTDRAQWAVLTNPTLPALFELPTGQSPDDVQIEAVKGAAADITFVDLDTHHWATAPAGAALTAWLDEIRPRPEAAWLTHGHGLRLVYVGPNHRARAITAGFAANPNFGIEFKSHTRHPLSTRAGATCGPVWYYATDPVAPYAFKLVGEFTPELSAQALEELDLTAGERYPHDRCPIAPGVAGHGNDSVQAYADHVFCFECAAVGRCYRSCYKAGYYPLAAVTGTERTELEKLAARWVHWTHARLDLKQTYPNIGEGFLREAYRLTLNVVAQKNALRQGHENYVTDSDPRIFKVFNADQNFYYAGLWRNECGAGERELDNDSLNDLPYCLNTIWAQSTATPDKPATWVASLKANGPRRSRAKACCPAGYRPVRLYRGLRPDVTDDCILIEADPRPRFKIEIGAAGADAVEAAWARIETAFPGISRVYLQGVLAAAICANKFQGGQPPQIAVEGPSGCSKNETYRLAASFFGDSVIKIKLNEELHYRIGSGLTEGHQFFNLDELQRKPKLFYRLDQLLELNATINWRPLYSKPLATPNKAVFLFSSAVLPEEMKRSPEFNRRIWYLHLYRPVPRDWMQTVGMDTALWRDADERHAHAANTILGSVYQLCTAHDFVFNNVAPKLGFAKMEESDDGINPDTFKKLYQFARDWDARKAALKPGESLSDNPFIENNPRFVRGWLDMDHPNVKALVADFVAIDEDSHRDAARMQAQNAIQTVSWNKLLGISEPDIECKVVIHGTRWGLRFQGPGMRGKQSVNEQLPPISSDDTTAAPAPAVVKPGALGWAKLREAGLVS